MRWMTVTDLSNSACFAQSHANMNKRSQVHFNIDPNGKRLSAA